MHCGAWKCRVLALPLIAALALPAGAARAWDANDPLEDVNRAVFEFNRTLDRVVMRPIAELYVLTLPHEVRRGVTNMLGNLGEPLNVTNNLLQGKTERAGASLMRFAVNSTVGIAGVFDAAGALDLERAPEDFGETLAVWGMGEGPYLVLPVLGPSNPRDATGLAVDWVTDPVPYAIRGDFGVVRTSVSAVDGRAAYLDEIETLEETSLDYYAVMRENYRQYRNNRIRDGAPAPVPSFDDFEQYDEEPEE